MVLQLDWRRPTLLRGAPRVQQQCYLIFVRDDVVCQQHDDVFRVRWELVCRESSAQDFVPELTAC